MQSALNLARRYLENFPEKPAIWHVLLLRLIFLVAMVTCGVLAGFISAALVFGFTRGTTSNVVPALVTFGLVFSACALYGLYVSLVVLSNRNLRLPSR